MYCPKGRRVPGDEEYAARVTVKAMDQLERLTGLEGTECFNNPETHPTPTMHGHPGRLVHDQQIVIAKNDCTAHGFEELSRRLPHLRGRTHLDRRNPDLVMRL